MLGSELPLHCDALRWHSILLQDLEHVVDTKLEAAKAGRE